MLLFGGPAKSLISMKALSIWMPLQTLLTTKSTDPTFDWSVFDNITFTDAESTGIEDKDRAFIAKYRRLVSGLLHS